MSINTISNIIANGIFTPDFPVGDYTEITVNRQTQNIYKIGIAANDTMSLNCIVKSILAGDIGVKFSFYRYSELDKTLVTYGSLSFSEWNSTLSKTFAGGFIYYVEIEPLKSSYSNVIGFTANLTNYVIIKTFSGIIGAGFEGDAELTVKREQSFDCTQPLHHEITDGVLPKGLTMTSEGLISGTILNLDCEDTSDSPSFNWFFKNNDGMTQSFGKQFRFKVKISILGYKDSFDEQWFCIMVYNNWSLDRDNFDKQPIVSVSRGEEKRTVRIETLPVLCEIPTTDISIKVPQIGKPSITIGGVDVVENDLYNYGGSKYKAHKDPTREYDTESFFIPDGTIIQTPNELVNHYMNNLDNADILSLQLSTSKLLPEFIRFVDSTDRFHMKHDYEMNIKGQMIEIRKYTATESRNIDDADEILISLRNTNNQVMPILPIAYTGIESRGILTW